MKKILPRLLPLLLGILFLFTVALPAYATAHTQRIQQISAHPLSQTCNPCESYVEWTGGTAKGGQTTFYIPSLSLSGTDYLIRTFRMLQSGATGDSLYIGYERNTDFGGACGSSSGQHLFVAEFSHAGALNYGRCSGTFVEDITSQFYALPSGSADEAYGVGCVGGTCIISGTITNVQSNLANSYLENDETVKTTVNGTFQGANYWTYNEYYNSSWNYQSNGPTPHRITTPAVQMYWNPTPNGATNHGGSLEMCEKDSGSTC